jgi:ATP-dependent Clp protease ATP-binding subunit ClpB
MDELRRHFRPEFLNRVDEVVLFAPLSVAQIGAIVGVQIARLRVRLAGRKITLDLNPAALDFIAQAAYDPVYGARPLKRYLQNNLETPLARAIVGGSVRDGQHVTVTVTDGNLGFVAE